MRAVVQNDKTRASRTRYRKTRVQGGLAVLAAVAVLGVPGCARDSTEVRSAPGQPLQAPPARALDAYATKLRAAHAAAQRWGLKRAPLPAPPPPAEKPEIRTRAGFEVDGHTERGLPPVFTTIPTKEKIVFLTIDDGGEKDRRFLEMMSELNVPYTAFLSDYLVKEDYGYFRTMQARGVTLNNHTLTHPYLPGLSYAEQRREICGMQEVIRERYGKRPAVFRPPFGNYDQDTLVAAKSCGVTHVPLWNEEVFVDHWDYREWDREIHPGDIVLTHFRGAKDWDGTMPDMVRRFLDKVTAEGYAVARLEDYL
ncbi:polysaccharide deacetylase family protein [Streptomyces griseoviridis]|uniref:polysaccharide deacetylase family protein n=1 Tax=Streptomyces griseoviridis TaxID=45398 RepID=UPI00167B3CC7|nr:MULTISPECIES: polysaccharide deacetylase family protein [Streptomyces]